LQEIAIIYARHRQIETIISLLEKKNIPYQVKRKVNLLDLPLVTNIRLMLAYIQLEYTRPYSGEHLLFSLLHTNFLGIDSRDLAEISRRLAKIDRKQRPHLRDYLQQITEAKNTTLNSIANIQRFNHFIQLALQDYRNYALPMLMERLLSRSGLLHFIIHQNDKEWQLQVIKTLFDFAHQESIRQPKVTIKQFLQTLDNMEKNRIRLELNKNTISESGVHLLTAHASKGLEFEKVYLIDSVQEYWEVQKRMANYRFGLPDTLTFSGEEDALEAKRRLFYVGMTRAKYGLQISCSQENEKGKLLQRAIFIDEILTNTSIQIEQQKVGNAAILDAQMLLMLEVERPEIRELPTDYVNELLSNFRLSVSSLNTYLRCPLSFFYEYVLQVPTLMSEAASYGEAMHRAWQRLYEQMMSRKSKLFPTQVQFIRYFEEELKNLRHQITDSEYQRRLEMGRKSLIYYYENHLVNWGKQVRVEFKIRNCEIEGVPITGTIDKLVFTSETTAKIVDYKTGKADPKKLARPTEKRPFGGNYYRQLVFYKLLYENYRPTDVRVKEGEIIFLDANQKGNYIQKSIKINSKDVQHLTQLIVETNKQIQAHDFYKGCGEKNCSWCNFVKRNQLMDSLRDVEIEELDD